MQQNQQHSYASSTDVNRFKIENYRLKAKIDELEKERQHEKQLVSKLQGEVKQLRSERSFVLTQHANALHELKGRRKEFEDVKELAMNVYNEAITVLKRKCES